MRRRWSSCCVLLVLLSGLTGCGKPSSRDVQTKPTGPAPIMKLDEVRVGMRGYGLSVFHGAKIEPFPIKVVSIVTDSHQALTPDTPAFWIECTDERMHINGPVQGMSGSPIYLWGDGEPNVLGKGGRLIGAFAFGYPGTKICYAGVTPIERMRQVGERSSVEDHDKLAAQAPGPNAAQTLRRLMDSAAAQGIDTQKLWRTAAIGKLLGADTATTAQARPAIPGPPNTAGHALKLGLPLNVGSAPLAHALRPLLAPAGIVPLAGGNGTVTGHPPPGIDVEKLKLEPGSVLAVPMVWGDMDFSASGTVTEVLPDGLVLAFGHAMDGIGDIATPMATGYVHLIMPLLDMSFKISGSGTIQGALIRDENAAVVGSPEGRFKSSSIAIKVQQHEQPFREFQFKMVQDKQLTPILAVIVADRTLRSTQVSPIESTLHLKSHMKFEGEYTLDVDTILPGAGTFDILFSMLPALTSMVQNNHESRMLESITVDMQVKPGLNFASLIQARLDRVDVAPGDTLGINLQIQPYGKPTFSHRIEMVIPEDLDDGLYQLAISDGQRYLQNLVMSRPHLMATHSVSDLHKMLQRILAVRDDAIYVSMQLPNRGLALGQLELPRLPSSRLAMIASPASTLATAYFDSIKKIEPMDMVINGDLRFAINIDRSLAE